MLRNTYKPLPETVIEDPLDQSKTISVRRWKLLADMPHYGVLAGSLTGYIDTKINISRAKNVWVDFDAIVYGSVILKNKVLIKDSAIVRGPDPDKRRRYWSLEIHDNVTIKENAIVGYEEQKNLFYGYIRDNVVIQGNTRIGIPNLIAENVVISGDVFVGSAAWISDNVEISGNARIGNDVSLATSIYITDNVHIGKNCSIEKGLKMDKDVEILPFAEISEGKIIKSGNNTPDGKEIFDVHQLLAESSAITKLSNTQSDVLELSNDLIEIKQAQIQPLSPQRKKWMGRLSELTQSMNSYESDIVKIIKYPVMMDLTDPFTAEMVFARKNADRAMDEDDDEFIAAITHLEHKFLIAESNAQKISTAVFTDEELKKTQQAKDLFALACNEATSEHEKRKALTQGFNRLTGIVTIPEKAIEAMRVKVGIAELEM